LEPAQICTADFGEMGTSTLEGFSFSERVKQKGLKDGQRGF